MLPEDDDVDLFPMGSRSMTDTGRGRRRASVSPADDRRPGGRHPAASTDTIFRLWNTSRMEDDEHPVESVRGSADVALLGLLAEGPKHPWEISKEVAYREM